MFKNKKKESEKISEIWNGLKSSIWLEMSIKVIAIISQDFEDPKSLFLLVNK